MKKSFVALAAACVALAACNKEQNPAQNIPMSGEPVAVTFSLRSAMTKAATTEEGTLNENKINRVDAFVFNADGTLDGYKKFDGPSVTAGDNSNIQVKATTGMNKRFVAIINAAGSGDNFTDDKMEEVDHINDLNSLTRLFQLRNNTRDGFQMYGVTSENLVSGDNKVSIQLNRAVARVKVDKITRDFDVPSLAKQTFKVKRMYLTNVVGSVANVAEGTGNTSDSKYFNTFKTALGDTWYNTYAQDAVHTSHPYDGYIRFTEDVNTKNLTVIDIPDENQTITDGASLSIENGYRFYAMPNDIRPSYAAEDDDDAKCLLKEQALQGLNYWAGNGNKWKPELTKLVIETELADKTYYYVIPIVKRAIYPEGKINAGIGFNETFNFKEIILTRAGSEDPDTPVSTANVIYDLEILPWTVQNMATNGDGYEI